MHYPANTLQLIRPHILPLQRAVMHHYTRRHNAAHRLAFSTWVKALRDAYASTGYHEFSLINIRDKATK